MMQRKVYAAAAAGGALVMSTLALTTTGNANTVAAGARTGDNVVRGQLNPLNNSGVTGYARIRVEGRQLHVKYDARRLARGLPHAAHIHFGAQARHECPTVRDDKNGDFRLNTTDGLPAYGPIVKSLTTRGDTSPASALAVTRFPTAPGGEVHYKRMMMSKKSVAHAVRHGKGVIVVHGVDYNANGKYDFASAGKSDLDPALPAEATDPATCGVLR